MALTKHEETILKSIKVPSDNNPNKPEFPCDNPKFPATPTYKIKVPGFSNVWMKDESHNPTGTHKDRMAWDLVVTYRNFLIAKKNGLLKGELPHMSIISSGSAATAIQQIFKKYGLPNLKVLVDTNIAPEILSSLKKMGCEVYSTDLSRKELSPREILMMTNNPKGIEITSSQALDPSTRFYDWLSYEILNNSPDYCFIPFGTGILYENILNINKQIVTAANADPRFKGNKSTLMKCNFMGATTNNPSTKATKLFSAHLPFTHFNEQWINTYKYSGYCGPDSNVYILQEHYLDEAINLAKSLGINCEPSGIAGLALMLQMKNKLPRDKKMLIVNTGKTKYQ
jgi:cysteine synthase